MSHLRARFDAQLLSCLHTLIRRENSVETELLYLGEGCSSMFAYCVRVLHFAESVAYKRIAVARAGRRYGRGRWRGGG